MQSTNPDRIKQWRDERNTDPRYNDAQVQVFIDWDAEIQAAKTKTKYNGVLLHISLGLLIGGLIGFVAVTFCGIDYTINHVLTGWSLQEFFISMMLYGWLGAVFNFIINIKINYV